MREAFFLDKVGCCKNIPFLFRTQSIVMSCHTIENKTITIYNALHAGKSILSHSWIKSISIAVQTVSFLHNANILHNDIKGDNFILGTMKQNHF